MNASLNIPDMTLTLQIRAFHLNVVDSDWRYPDHYHHSFELPYCYSGEVTEWVNGQPMLFRTGDWLLIPPSVRHETVNTGGEPFTYLSLVFDIDDPDFRREMKKLPLRLVTSEEAKSSHAPHILKEIDRLLSLHPPVLNDNVIREPYRLPLAIKLGLQANVMLLIADLAELLRDESILPSDSTANRYEVETANRIEKWVIEALHDPELSVNKIAHKAGLSRTRCTKLFTRIFGMSPRQYITSVRLLQAKQKLIHSSSTIEEIAMSLGFSSLSHFSRQFKRWTSQSPMQYRPKNRIHYPSSEK